MRVLFATSEAVPFAKVGGLGDVAGALPIEIAKLGVDVQVVMPLYRQVRSHADRLEDTGLDVSVALGADEIKARLWRSTLPNSQVPIYFLESDRLYDREGIYGPSGGKYEDNHLRFFFLSRGSLELARVLGASFDIIHAQDWPTGLIPAYLRSLYSDDPFVKDAVSIFTIHNLAHKGLFSLDKVTTAGLGGYSGIRDMVVAGKLSLLKAALSYADALTTVSCRYASEIQTEEFGEGFEDLLASRAEDVHGILNGIDYSVWNPETDTLIPSNYSAGDLSGKARCKADLQRKTGLAERDDVPVVGIVCRFCEQKGLDLVVDILDRLLVHDVQLVVLGTGDPEFETRFRDAAAANPGKVAAIIGFNETMAHQIEAGSDMFLMPSKFEPCGLNQMISLKYGTIPIVRATGGLADTIVDCAVNRPVESQPEVNGFSFDSSKAGDLLASIENAISLHGNRDEWERLVVRGMKQDWSWRRSARKYVALYESAIARKSHGRKMVAGNAN